MCGSPRFFSPNFAASLWFHAPCPPVLAYHLRSIMFLMLFHYLEKQQFFCVLRHSLSLDWVWQAQDFIVSRESEDLYEFEWFQNIISHFDLHVLNKFHTWLTLGCNFSFPPVLNFTVFYIWCFNWCEKLCQQCSLNRARHECGSTNISRSVKYFAGLTVLFINLTNHNGRQLE